jgi:predicted ester cyclase
VDIEDIVAEGDRVAVRWRVSMTHLGDHLGFPATGKKGTLDGSSFLIVKDNQVMEGWNQMDLQGLMQRLQAV